MKKTLLIGLPSLLLVLGLVVLLQGKETSSRSPNPNDVPPPPQSVAGAVTITMSNNTYTPSRIEIKRGQTVTFANEGSEDYWPASNIHPTHEIYPEFDPKRPIGPRQSWSFTFDKVGKWYFHDHLTPSSTGMITVQE